MNDNKDEIKKDKEEMQNLIVVTLFIIVVFVLIGTFSVVSKTRKASFEGDQYVDVTGGRFEIINEYLQSDGTDSMLHYYIAYDKVTKVMYVIGNSEEGSPTFTVMIGETGGPILYAGKGE